MLTIHLVKLSLYAAYRAEDEREDAEALGDRLAEDLRSGGALTVATDVDVVEEEMSADDTEDTDTLVDAFAKHWPAINAFDEDPPVRAPDTPRVKRATDLVNIGESLVSAIEHGRDEAVIQDHCTRIAAVLERVRVALR